MLIKVLLPQRAELRKTHLPFAGSDNLSFLIYRPLDTYSLNRQTSFNMQTCPIEGRYGKSITRPLGEWETSNLTHNTEVKWPTAHFPPLHSSYLHKISAVGHPEQRGADYSVSVLALVQTNSRESANESHPRLRDRGSQMRHTCTRARRGPIPSGGKAGIKSQA